MATDSTKRIDIVSVGDASPHDAARVALGLGVSVPDMVRAFYQSPATLVDGIDEPLACALSDVLASLGCEVQVAEQDAPAPRTGPLLDVAVRVTDESRFERIAAAASTFLGCADDEARRLLLASPPVLVGQVSAATVEALQRRLGDGAEVITSDPSIARYDLLLGDCPAPSRSRLLSDLRAQGHDPAASGPWLLRDLTGTEAHDIWSTHQRIPSLRITNQDFYRFELVLDGGRPDEDGLAALLATGVPADVVPQLFDSLPIIVADELPDTEVKRLLSLLTAAGLEAHATLATFLHLGVRVTDWRSPTPARAALVAAGVADPPTTPPFTVGPWPDLTARLVRGMLQRSGAEADLTDADLIDAGR
ncbi:hypothetical protein CFK38_04165 [Brachybacterium vulturis]|uniref:Uncharacterized protein n=1 Tax=Brachybacterium vulturis TaxID=2017484 RepID=A0A291GKD8_9MICO|nr:hypothetical protein [Brachybacterium vulturis]ATG50809.1 hypothetical protein CFK38_04165 [Brachybacterium vulturis]